MSNILSWCCKLLVAVVLRSALCQCHFFTVITWSLITFCNSVLGIYYFSVLSWRQRQTLNHQRVCVVFLRQQRNLLPMRCICRHQQVLDSSDRSYGVQNLMDFYFEQTALRLRPHSLHWALQTFWQRNNISGFRACCGCVSYKKEVNSLLSFLLD